MRDYAKIAPQFWTGETGRKIRKLGPEGVAIALYLLTCPHANAFGMYYLPLGYMAYDVGMSPEGASEWLQKVCATGFCAYDDEAEVIWIRNMARFQIGEEVNPKDNRAKSGRYLIGKRLTSFERFWAAFAFAKGKAEAADAWLNIPALTNALVIDICRAAELEARQRIEDTAKGKSPKWAQGWLTARRWEDYAVSAGVGTGASLGVACTPVAECAPTPEELEANRQRGLRHAQYMRERGILPGGPVHNVPKRCDFGAAMAPAIGGQA